MDPISQIIMISIGNVVAWLAAIYVKDALPGLIGNLVISTTGAFAAGYLCLRFLPEFDKLGMIAGAFIGAILLLSVIRLRTWHWFENGN